MPTAPDLHYRMPHLARGARPGAHRGASLGVGQAFVAHRRLFDWPDPRRLDLRASLRTPGDDWLVRVHRQRVAVTVQAVVDVSASMRVGAPRSKLEVAGDLLHALAASAFRAGDALGLLPFDAQLREDLVVPARHARGIGAAMADALARSDARAGAIAGLADAVRPLAGREALVFLVSDFHWPLDGLPAVLDALGRAHVVPIVAWDAAETEPPARDGLVRLEDSESGARRTLWMRASLRRAWRDAAAQRRAALDAMFAARGLHPFVLGGAFDADALSRHLLEAD